MKNNILLVKRQGQRYVITTRKDFEGWPEKTRRKFVIIDEGTRSYLENKVNHLTKFCRKHGRLH